MFDNGQPPEWVGQFAAFLFVMWIFLSCLYGWTHPNNRFVKKKKPAEDLDFSEDIFYMDDGLQMIPALDMDEAPARPSPKRKKHTVSHSQEFVEDCVSVLSQLGYNKTQAKKSVKTFLSKNNPSTVEVFLDMFFKKAS